ncbi:hypothetical protein F4604DRAFT_2741 [Suillus subluteus]|nr:hypothetical protein F4604DRAFT_2741 [Suillus subluteus]
MHYFSRAQFFNFCGLPQARLDAHQSIFVKEKKKKMTAALSWIINVALFGAPPLQMKELRRVWVNRFINFSRWKTFYSKSMSE